jgi:hypothetical protein
MMMVYHISISSAAQQCFLGGLKGALAFTIRRVYTGTTGA